MTFRKTPAAFAVVAFVTIIAGPAVADEATESFLKSWVASIDASPDWKASYASLASNGTATTLSGLTVASEKPGFTLTVDSIAVAGFVPSSDGTFVASDLRLDGGHIDAGKFAGLEIASAEFTEVSLPSASGFVWDESRPFVSLIKAAAPLTKVAMRTGRIGSVVLLEKVDDVESRIAYEAINIDNWASGKIGALSAGPIHSESPGTEPLTAITIASATSRDINLNTLFEVFDPDSYGPSGGDMVWRDLIGKTTYRDMVAAMPGVSFTMSEATLESVRLRQPKGGIGILAELGPDSSKEFEDNPDKGFAVMKVLTAYGFGKFEMRDLALRAPGVDRMTLAGMSMSDFSGDLLGEFALDRLEVAIEDQGAVTVRRFAFGDLVPPSLEAFAAAVKAQTAGEDVDVSSVLPQLGFVEASGVDVAVVDKPRTTLESLRIDLKDYIGPVPTTVSWDLVDADIDAALIDDPKAKKLLADLGYDRVVLDSSLRANWTAAGEINVEEFRLAMKDVGALYGDVRVSGITPTEALTIDEDKALEKLSFLRGSVTAKDDSIVGRGLAMQATQLGVDPTEFRQQFAMGLPFMLAFLGDPKLQADLTPVLQQFIKTAGGTLSLLATPAEPIPLALLAEIGDSAPFSLLKKLNVTFSGLPGVTPPPATAAAPAPAPETAPAPEPETEATPTPESDGDSQFDTAPDDDTQFDTGPTDDEGTDAPASPPSKPTDSKPSRS